MKKYDSYKDSGVEWIGEIPFDWIITRSKYYFENRVEKNNEDEPLLSVTQNKSVVRRDELETNVWNPDSDISGYKLIKEGDFVISLRTFEGGIELSEIQGIVSPVYSVLKVKTEVNKRYFKHLFKSNTFITELNKVTTGIRQGKNISYDDFSNIIIPVPSIKDQSFIGKFLDTKTSLIDSLIEKTKRKIELLKEKRTSLINEVVTKGLNPNVEMKDSGVEWIGEIPNGWEKKKLGYISKLFTGNPWKSELFNFDNGIKIVRGENVSEGFLRWGSRTRFWVEPVEENSIFYLKDGDIVIGMDGSKVGKNYVRIKEGDLPLLLHQRMCRIRVSQGYSPKFIEYWIGSEMFRFYIDISKTDPMIPHITQKNIFDFQIPFPPLSEQYEIVYHLDEHTQLINKTIFIEEKRIELLKEYRQSLISEVVTGKVKVTN